MDKELAAYLDKRFRENARQLESLRSETHQHLARLEDALSQTRVAVEDLWDQINQVAQGVIVFGEKMDLLKSDTLLKFDEVRASMVPYYQDLNRRVGILEGRADRQTRDIIDVIREKFGKPQA